MKILRRLFNFIIAFGVFMIIGSAGLSDLETTTFSQSILQIIIAFGFIAFGVFGKRVLVYTRITKLNKVRNKSIKQNYSYN